MTRHETGSTATPGAPRATAPPPRTFGPQGPTPGDLIDAYLQDYQVRQFRSHRTARGRVAHLAAFFGRAVRAAALTSKCGRIPVADVANDRITTVLPGVRMLLASSQTRLDVISDWIILACGLILRSI